MQRQKKPLVSIIILNWNRPDETLECLKHVRKLNYSNTEVIVVDNGSDDNSLKVLSEERDITLVKNKTNRGFTGGHVDGLKHANGEFILILNNDAVIKPDYIDKALPYFNDDGVAVVGGRAYFWNDDYPDLSEDNPFYSYQVINPITAEGIFEKGDKGIAREVNTVSGSGVVIRRSSIEEVGYLYEPFFAYYEETDLFARMKRAGYKVLYSPNLSIWHKSGSSSTAYFQYKQLFKNRFLFAVRNFDTKYVLPFLKSYIKIGLKSSLLRLRKSEQQTLHRAFSNAFLWNAVHWPAAFISRGKLKSQLGKSDYSRKIINEQIAASVVVDFTSSTDNQLADYVKRWVELNGAVAQVSLVVVHASNATDTKNSTGNVRFVHDKKYFNKQSLNLGWLSTNAEYIMFAKAEDDTPNAEELLDRAVQMHPKNSALSVNVLSGKLKPLYDASIIWDVLVRRSLLVHTGGLHLSLKPDEALRSLVAYGNERHSSHLIIRKVETNSASVLADPEQDWGAVHAQINKQLRLDKAVDKLPSRWQTFLDSHYIVYHARNYSRWLLSPHIRPRTKVARTGRLITYTSTLKRKRVGMELLHIRNEFLKSSSWWSDIESTNKHVRRATKESLKSWQNIPVFIICRDRLSPLMQLISWLEEVGMKRIILIDNDSLYPPLLEYFDKTPYQVIRTNQNIGHTVPWTGGLIRALLPDDYYIVTDPDVIPSENCPKDAIQHFIKLHQRFFLYQKVGFGLRIDDLPDGFALKDSVVAWESQFWSNKLGDETYEAGIDTTFAVYKPFTYKYMLHPSIRTGEPYVARHLPWYIENGDISAEERFYRDHVNNKITSWNVDKLPERYAKELNV